jgi:Tol biopolymer transport system component
MQKIIVFITSILLLFTSASVILAVDPQPVDTNQLASLSSTGVQGNAGSENASISANGRYVAFNAGGTTLVEGDTGGIDVFVHDRYTGTTLRISVAFDGSQANGEASYPFISSTGRYVVFSSTYSNLVANDTNDALDVFVHDRDSDVDGIYDEPGAISTQRVSVDSNGGQGSGGIVSTIIVPTISANERYVTFHSLFSNLVISDTNDASDVFVFDLQTSQTVRISVASDGSEGNGASLYPMVSSDGRYVSFSSRATNFAAGDTNGKVDLFRHDRDVDADGIFDEPGQISTVRVSVSSSGEQGNGDSGLAMVPVMDPSGRYIVFTSFATNLVSDDTNGQEDVFVHDMQTGETTRVSVSSNEEQANLYSQTPAISPGGRYIAFSSASSNLTPGDTNNKSDIFLRDLLLGTTTRVTLGLLGAEPNNGCAGPSISADGRLIAFQSNATNLVENDLNGMKDIFVRHIRLMEQSVYLPLLFRAP